MSRRIVSIEASSSRRRSSRSRVTRLGSRRLRTWKPSWLGSLSGVNGVVRRAQVSSAGELRLVRQGDECRQTRIVGAAHFRDHRAGRGKDVVVHFGGRLIAGQHPMRAHAVAGVGVGHAADNRHLVHDLGLQWQVLADLRAGHIGGDRPELAADLDGSLGLEVVHVELAGSAGLPDQNHGRVLDRPASRRSRRPRRSTPGSVKPPIDSEPIFSRLRRRDAVASLCRASSDFKHGEIPCRDRSLPVASLVPLLATNGKHCPHSVDPHPALSLQGEGFVAEVIFRSTVKRVQSMIELNSLLFSMAHSTSSSADCRLSPAAAR